MNYCYFTSESVCEGHPDKICDQISDSIVDNALKVDPYSRVAVETMVTKNQVSMAGEVTCTKPLNFDKIARRLIKKLSYTKKEYNFSDKSPINVYIHQQSADIALGVDKGGAGDQGMMFGYAVAETPELMPLPITLAHRLAQRVDELKKKKLPYLRPDGKTEVTIKYEKCQPVGVERMIVAVPYDTRVSKEQLTADLYKNLVLPVLESYKQKPVNIKSLIVNGTGKWEIGGPAADTGVTGRKIIVDTYGAMSRIGGGCFSGKDPTKVDRSGAYAARYIAKNIVAAGLASRCEVQIAYVIGYKLPIAKAIETFGTETKRLKVIEDFAWKLLDLSVEGIINGLSLRQPIYQKTARYGHFGHQNYPWEKIVS